MSLTGEVDVSSVFHPSEGRLLQAAVRWRIDNWQQLLRDAAAPDSLKLFPFIKSPAIGAAALGIATGSWQVAVPVPKFSLSWRLLPELTISFLPNTDAPPPLVPELAYRSSCRMLPSGASASGAAPPVAIGAGDERHPFWCAGHLVMDLVITPRCNDARAGLADIEAASVAMEVQGPVRDLYLQPEATDFVLVSSDGKQILAHRVVLAANCEYFRAMFDHESQETKTGVCTTIGVDYETLKAVIDWLYGVRVVSHVPEVLEKVVAAADMYHVADLKLVCMYRLIASTTLDNAVHRFVFAKRFGMDELSDIAVRCIRANWNKFVDENGLDVLEATAPDLKNDFLKILGSVF